jgi:UDP-galactopyranose mutase
MKDPADQASIPHPRLGFYGVIDERIDLDLLAALADAQTDWQLVLVGPTAKIDLDTLPKRTNIHYLGSKSYADLPTYLAGWDVAIMPFAHNESTRFISPTKTLEYLAGGKPVVSTSIHDVVSPYGQQGLVSIADTADEFIAAVKEVMKEESTTRLSNVDLFLSQTSWDITWGSMRRLIAPVAVSRKDKMLYSMNSSPAARPSLSADTSILGGMHNV